MWLPSYTINFTMPSFHMVVCAGTINFVIVPNVARIGPIEPGVFKIARLPSGALRALGSNDWCHAGMKT